MRPPSLARCLVGPTCRRCFLHPRSPPLSLCLVGPVRQLLSRCPAYPSLCVVGLPYQIHPPCARRGPASAHLRTSPDFSATTPTHMPSSLLRAPPVPHAHPRLISRGSTHSRALPTPPATAGDPRPCSRPSSSPETAPGLPELRPEVRLLPPCLFYSIRACS
jgi:hypothetical protein